MDERSSPPTSPASPFVPQRPTDVEEIRRGNLSKLRRHLGTSVPSDLVPPKFDGGEASDGLSGDAEVYGDPPTVPAISQRFSGLADPIVEKRTDEKGEKLIRIWLREKNGRRWVEDNYDTIIQSLREL
jgi:hypothetical protein